MKVDKIQSHRLGEVVAEEVRLQSDRWGNVRFSDLSKLTTGPDGPHIKENNMSHMLYLEVTRTTAVGCVSVEFYVEPLAKKFGMGQLFSEGQRTACSYAITILLKGIEAMHCVDYAELSSDPSLMNVKDEYFEAFLRVCEKLLRECRRNPDGVLRSS